MGNQANHLNYSLTKAKKENVNKEDFINLLPRAVIRPNSFILLDGAWNFAVDPKNRGLTEHWYLSHQYSLKAHLPGSVETHIANSYPNENKLWQKKIIVWYEREFPLPDLTTLEQTHSLLQLTFGACGYQTRVWLNGHPLRTIEKEEVHTGGYTSFSYELDPNLLHAVNQITIRITSSMDADAARGKQESSVYKRGGIWYQTYSGGVRSIWLETVERNRLRSRVGVLSLNDESLVKFNFTTRIHDPGHYIIRLKIFHRKQDNNNPIAEDQYPLILEAGQKRQRLVIELKNVILWSTENPHLYTLIAQLICPNGHISEIETNFGLRKIETRGPLVYLNNKAVYLNGILYQPGVADYEQIKKHMFAMKELGCNLVRIHIAGVDPRIYNLADKLGLLLWVEVPSPHRSTDKSRKNHKEELLRMLALIGTHPSVIIWSLYNEDWGAQDIATNPKTRQYICDMYHYMKISYPQFLVIDNDGWQHISQEGRLKTDLLTLHLYTPELSKWKDLLDKVVQGIQINVAAFPLIVGDPFFYRKQTPLVVSEWGGFGFADYGGPADSDQRTEYIKLFKEELKCRPIAGDVYTQATNIEDEQNGIIDFTTGELKVPPGTLS
jgi:beta-galactosidase/beta-glucuronidase